MLLKVMWYPKDTPNSPICMDDIVTGNLARGTDIKNNVFRFTLKNPATRFRATDSKMLNKYVNDDGSLKFQDNDQVKLFCHYSDNFAEIEDSRWDNDNDTVPDDTYLLGVFYIIEWNPKMTENTNEIVLKCADKTYILFNQLWPQAFTITQALTAPEIIQKVIRHTCQTQDGYFQGSGSDPNVYYDVDARLTTDSPAGYITNERRNTKENGDTNSDLSFPVVSIAKIWKPVYEWIDDLSQIGYLNTEDELNNDLVYGRPFIYWVDENNKFHWIAQTNEVVEDDAITIGTKLDINEYNLNRSVFDVQNFIVFRGGNDLYGSGTLGYYIDPTSNVGTKKMRVVPMTDVADKIIKEEINYGHIEQNAAGAFSYAGFKYQRTGNITSSWVASETYTSDATYNTALKKEINRRCTNTARSMVSRLAHARYKGTIDRKGTTLTIGNLFTFDDQETGVRATDLRLIELRHNFTKNGWFTQMSVEEGAIPVTSGARATS